MTVYVDEARWPYGRMRMAHMMADTLPELHAFARRLGMDPGWFQDDDRFPHYDISKGKRELAIRWGAVPITSREMVQRATGRQAK